MMLYPCHFYINGEYLGTGQTPGEQHTGGERIPRSFAFFCPVCGEIWARAHIEGSEYSSWAIRCGKHEARYQTEIPGSIWLPWDRTHNESLPASVLRREISLHFSHAEKFNICEEWSL